MSDQHTMELCYHDVAGSYYRSGDVDERIKRLRAEMDKLRAETERLRAMMEWRPIESAPWDGGDMLVYNPVSCEMFVAYQTESGRWSFAVGHVMKNDPSHWIPLPPAPTTTEREV